MRAGTAKSPDALIDAVVRGELDEAQTLRLCTECPELVTLALRAAGKRIAELQGLSQDHAPSSSTPSGMVPVYTKPNRTKRRKKPGAKKGHPGCRRGPPKRTNASREHRLRSKPDPLV
jgi:hypothetical protein